MCINLKPSEDYIEVMPAAGFSIEVMLRQQAFHWCKYDACSRLMKDTRSGTNMNIMMPAAGFGQLRDPGYDIQDPVSSNILHVINDLRSGIRDTRYSIQDPRSKFQDTGFEIQDTISKLRDPSHRSTKNLKMVHSLWAFFGLTLTFWDNYFNNIRNFYTIKITVTTSHFSL